MLSSESSTAGAKHFRYRSASNKWARLGLEKSMQAARLCLVELAGSPSQASRRQAYLFYSCNGLFQQWFTSSQATFAAKLVSILLHFVCVVKTYQVPTDTATDCTLPCCRLVYRNLLRFAFQSGIWHSVLCPPSKIDSMHSTRSVLRVTASHRGLRLFLQGNKIIAVAMACPAVCGPQATLCWPLCKVFGPERNSSCRTYHREVAHHFIRLS